VSTTNGKQRIKTFNTAKLISATAFQINRLARTPRNISDIQEIPCWIPLNWRFLFVVEH